jgi:hypothetical protein
MDILSSSRKVEKVQLIEGIESQSSVSSSQKGRRRQAFSPIAFFIDDTSLKEIIGPVSLFAIISLKSHLNAMAMGHFLRFGSIVDEK